MSTDCRVQWRSPHLTHSHTSAVEHARLCISEMREMAVPNQMDTNECTAPSNSPAITLTTRLLLRFRYKYALECEYFSSRMAKQITSLFIGLLSDIERALIVYIQRTRKRNQNNSQLFCSCFFEDHNQCFRATTLKSNFCLEGFKLAPVKLLAHRRIELKSERN